jgi:hypothetical protein
LTDDLCSEVEANVTNIQCIAKLTHSQWKIAGEVEGTVEKSSTSLGCETAREKELREKQDNSIDANRKGYHLNPAVDLLRN